jgi:hypothetical protein
MDGHARLSGKIHKDLLINGKTYTLSRPALVGVYAEMEAFLVSRKSDPIVLAVEACRLAPAAMHATIWEAAMKTGSSARIATAEEMAAFEASPWGIAFKLWKCLDKKHEQEFPTPESAMKLLEEIGDNLPELTATLAVVSGEADLGNSSGRSPKAPAEKQPTDTPSSADGRPSTSSSPTPTVGP